MTPRDDSDAMSDPIAPLAAALERDLLARYGPLLGNDDLRQSLGYLSMDAFRQAMSRRQLPVPVFSLPNRRGKYALVKDVADWLARTRAGALFPSGTDVSST